MVLLLLVTKEHEHGDSCCDDANDEILVRREFAAVEEHVHEHDRNEFTQLCQHHGRVRDVGEGGKAERSGCGNKERALDVKTEDGVERWEVEAEGVG